MPLRRASASAGHNPSTSTTSHRHKSSDSHQASVTQSSQSATVVLSTSSLGAVSSPQHRIIQVLINRLKHKLPCHSGVSIDVLEQDKASQEVVGALVDLSSDFLDVITWKLCELLERLATQTDTNGLFTLEVFQSQLFILKVLSVAMASRWNQYQDEHQPSSRLSKKTSGKDSVFGNPDSPVPEGSTAKKPRHHHSSVEPSETAVLDDNCARYLLSVMVMFLRQTSGPELRLTSLSTISVDTSFHEFEVLDLSDAAEIMTMATKDLIGRVPELIHPLRSTNSSNSISSSNTLALSHIPLHPRSLRYEQTHALQAKSSLVLNSLIAKFAGRIVYHLSASNWSVVFHRLRTKIHFLAQTTEAQPDTIDLHLMTHSAFDRTRVVQVLNELSSLLVNMKREVQIAVSIPLRAAIWNWIEIFPAEFNDAIRSRGRMEGAPERVFDLLYLCQTGNEKVLWPTLTVLNCISADRLSSDFHMNHFGSGSGYIGGQKNNRKDNRFIEELVRHANTASKFSEVAIICCLDMCKAAAYIHPEGDIPLRNISYDIAHEVKLALWKNHLQKPFWESGEEIDVEFYALAMVILFRFLPEDESIPLITMCLEPERSEAVKICVVKACLTLVLEAPRVRSQKPLVNLAASVCRRFRQIFKATALRRNEIDQYGNIKRTAPRPKVKRVTIETLPDREVLLLGLLSMWRASSIFFMAMPDGAEINDWFLAIMKLWEGQTDNAVKISAACSFRLTMEVAFGIPIDHPVESGLMTWLRLGLPENLIGIVTNLIHARSDSKEQRLWIDTAHKIVEQFCREIPTIKEVQLAPARVPALALAEIAFLVSLTSADTGVAQLAAQCLRLMTLAERRPGAPQNTIHTDEELSKRNPIYEQLGDPNVAVIGRVGYQKRIRKFIRLIAYPSPSHVAVWEECYWRWRSLTEFVIQALPENLDHTEHNHLTITWEEKRIQWRNLTLFLAAFGGACVSENQDQAPLTAIIPAQYLPDAMRAPQNPGALVESYITDLTNLLVVDSMQVREVAREALGSELSPRLYSRLLKHLDEVIRRITQGAGSDLTDTFALFLDQFIAVLKLLVENAQVPVEEVLSIDISTTLLALAGFIARFNDPMSHRIKMKYCALCESVLDRADTLSLRGKDTGARHNILDIVMEWIGEAMGSEDPESKHGQVDLNLCCLRTAVKLLDRLQLRPLDNSTGDDSGHVVSRLFGRYSAILLKGLDICQVDAPTGDTVSDVPTLQRRMRALHRGADVRELVITGLSHLVSANTESGFKHCLPLAYDEDIRKRTIFAHVFSRVLGQGTKFDAQEDNSAAAVRRQRLSELVKGSDMVLAMAICETCPASDVDHMISVLIKVFDTRSSLMHLLKLMIDREIAHTESEASLFRSNSTCTRFLSHFAKIHGYNYLRGLIIPLIKTMVSMPPGYGFELDPNKPGGQDTEQNQQNVEMVAKSFLAIIGSSVPALPSMFREICAYIAKLVNEVWPESKFAALGAFMFLRFISPAIVAPETVDVELPEGGSGVVIRRGLMVVAKIIQNLANNIFFGKEAFMVSLNTFLEENIGNVTRYLSEIIKYPVSADEEVDEWLGSSTDDTDVIVLHRYFNKHADKIGKELLSYSKPVNENDDESSDSLSGKHAWDALCAVLVELGEPLEAPRLSSATRSQHREYIDLMSRFTHRPTDAVQGIFVETEAPKNQPAMFILHASKIDVEVLDVELLMFHIFSTLSLPAYEDRDFEVIVDCTSFTSLSEVPVQWLKYCTELIPSDIRRRFMTTYILNPNAFTHRYLRRIYNVSAGTPFSGEVRIASSVSELLTHDIPNICVKPLVNAMSLEAEPSEEFKDVTMRQHQQMRVPVVLEVGTSHLRITSVKGMPVSPLLTCRTTEIVSLTDVSDVYNVSTGHDPYEFIIRRSRQGVTLYFASPSRDYIVKAIRTAKGKLRDTQMSVTERFLRYSNVPATLLHVGLLSIDAKDEELRRAAYDLLGAVCTYLGYDKNPVVAPKAGIIPGDPTAFAVQLSDRLADFMPAMTLDFLSEVSAGMGDNNTQCINCLQYMSPWMKNLAHFPNPISPHFENSGGRLRDSIRALTDMTTRLAPIATTVQKCIWAEIGKLDSTTVNLVLDELIRTATDGGVCSDRSETIARIVAGLSSINVRGRIYSKLRRALGKTSNKGSKSFVEDSHWNEIATLVRLVYVAGNQSKQVSHHQLYVPEIMHVASFIAGIGPTLIRKSVYGIVMNLLQSLYLTRAEDAAGPNFLTLINDCTQPETLQLFGLTRSTSTSDYTDFDPNGDKVLLDTLERLSRLLVRIMDISAGSQGLLNVWRARWMSLATSTAFQLSPAIQTRAFVVLATLATSDVDDDLFYQMLVAFKTALSQSTETDTTSIISMLRCMCRVLPAVSDKSRFTVVVFWMAVALLQSSHMAFYIEAADLLRIALERLETLGSFRRNSMSYVLLKGRVPLEDIACQLDQLLGLSFDSSFSFSLASTLFKGLRHGHLRASGEAALRTLLRVTVRSSESNNITKGPLNPDALGYFLALLPLSTTRDLYRRLLQDCKLDTSRLAEESSDGVVALAVPRPSLAVLGITDSTTALYVASFVGAILTSAQGNDAESEILYTLLSDLAGVFPEVVSMTYDVLQDRIKDTFANSANASIIRAVSIIFRVAIHDPAREGMFRGSASTVGTAEESGHGPGRNHLLALDEFGMQGLASSFQFLPPNRGHATKMINWIPELVIRIIE